MAVKSTADSMPAAGTVSTEDMMMSHCSASMLGLHVGLLHSQALAARLLQHVGICHRAKAQYWRKNLTLTLTFDLRVIECRSPAMGYRPTKFGVDSSSRFLFIAQTDKQTKHTDATEHYPMLHSQWGIINCKTVILPQIYWQCKDCQSQKTNAVHKCKSL